MYMYLIYKTLMIDLSYDILYYLGVAHLVLLDK